MAVFSFAKADDRQIKDEWVIEAVIGMVKSTNHRFRVVTVFRRVALRTQQVGTADA